MPGILSPDAQRMIAEQRLAFVATVCPDGTPNVSPKGTIDVWDDDHLVFADIRSPLTVSNLRRNPAIELNVVDPFLRKGFRFKGTAEVVRDGELFGRLRDFYQSRRGGSDSANRLIAAIRSFVLMKVERVLPVVSPAYDDGAEEDSVRARWIAYYANLHSK